MDTGIAYMVQVLGISFAHLLVPILRTYRYLVRFSASHLHVASAPQIIAMFAYNWLSES